MQCPGSECLLSMFVRIDFYGLSHLLSIDVYGLTIQLGFYIDQI
jgi:hypothetical protein